MGGGKDGAEGGMPDMSSLMSMMGGGGGMGGKGGMGDMMGGMGGKGGKGGGQPADDSEKTTDKYVWSQKGEEVQIRLTEKSGLTKKDVKKVDFKRFSVKVELTDGTVLLDGKLFAGVEADDCCWSFDPDTKQIQLMLTKQDEKKEWMSLLQ